MQTIMTFTILLRYGKREIGRQPDMREKGLEKLGYDEWFQSEYAEALQDGFNPARVIEVNRNSYTVSDGKHEMPAELPENKKGVRIL